MQNRFLILLLFSIISAIAFPQEQAAVRQYINTYKEIAISEMKRTGVPAAIKLAQQFLKRQLAEATLYYARIIILESNADLTGQVIMYFMMMIPGVNVSGNIIILKILTVIILIF